MKALSVRQPWAWAIACAGKTVENRSRVVAYRGFLAIHASKVYDEAAEIPVPAALSLLMDAVTQEMQGYPPPALALGAIVAVATLDGCHWHSDCLAPRKRGRIWQALPCSDWAERGQFHWTLTDVRPLAEPVPCKGALGLWRVPDEAEAAVRAQLETGDHQ